MAHETIADSLIQGWNASATAAVARIKHTLDHSPFPRSFLHELAREGDVLSAEAMFMTGHDIDLMDDAGRRPLHDAATYGQLEMVQFLIENGAYIDAGVYPFGHTALYMAVYHGHYDVVKYLLAHRANIHAMDAIMGTGVLHLCAQRGDIKMAGILIAAGADVLHMNRDGKTARDTAAEKGHTELEEVLMKVMMHHAMLVEKY